MLALLLFPPDPRSPLDRAVARVEGAATDAIHAAILAADAYYESVWPTVRMMPAERLPESVRRVPLDLTDQQATAVVAYLRARVGTMHYSVQALLSDAVGIETGWRLPIARTAADCSGLVAEALVAAGVVTTVPRDPGSVTPQELARWADAGSPRDLGALLGAAATSKGP